MKFEYLIPNENGKGKAFESKHTSRKGSFKVIDIITNQIYNSIKEASISVNIPDNSLGRMLKGQSKNKTNLRFYEN